MERGKNTAEEKRRSQEKSTAENLSGPAGHVSSSGLHNVRRRPLGVGEALSAGSFVSPRAEAGSPTPHTDSLTPLRLPRSFTMCSSVASL